MATMQETGAKLREIEIELNSLDAAERDLTTRLAAHPNFLSTGTSGFRGAASELGSEINEAAGQLAKIRVDRETLLGEQARLKAQGAEAVSVTQSPQPQVIASESAKPAPSPPPPPPTLRRHPIVDVEGKFARMTDVIDLVVDNDEFAFSDTVRAGLTMAFGDKLRLGDDQEPIVGIGNFLRGCLAQTSRSYQPDRPPFTLAEAMVAFLTRHGDTPRTLEQLQRLITAEQPANWQATVADPGLTRVLSDAARVVLAMTPGQTRIDMRHVLIAALKTQQGQRLFYRIDAVGPSPDLFFAALFGEIKSHVLSHASGAQGKFDDLESASRTIDALEYLPDAAPRPPLQRSAVHYAGDRELKTLAEDQLGVADEARALAEVICLREPGPPLAVGLFGDWGSGKSSFMNLLRGAIDELTGKVDPNDAAAATMVRKVVHVKFNAWHYNDANLWASITTEFFAQLRAGGFDKQADVQYTALVNAVAERVVASERALADSTAAEREAETRLGEINEQLDQLKKDQARAPIRALVRATTSVMDDAVRTHPRRVVEAMALAGQPLEIAAGKEGDPEAVAAALQAKQGALKEEFERAASWPGHLRLILATAGRAAGKGDFITILLLLGLAGAVAGGAWLLLEASHQDFKTVATGIAGTVAVLGGIWRRAYNLLGPVIRTVGTFAKSRAEEEARLKKEIEDKTKAQNQAESEIGIAKLAREKSAREATRFKGGSPDQLLDWLLNVSDETRRFEKELGTISQVRRLFEQLDAIFMERAKLECQVEEPGLKLEERRHAEKKLSTAKGVTDGIDRIVLYIDDLDRCNAKQVVKVLEAVHLLLAFPLFVVVVGVDARWLKHALLKVYQKELHDSDRSKLGHVDRASEQDYLEKIFQVPIHLKPLRGGTYFNSFLLSVAGPVAQQGGGANPPPPPAPAPTPSLGSGQRTIQPVDVKVGEETIQQTVQRISLQPHEVKQIGLISTLLAKSPRAVKRFMNVYRLIRGLKRGADLDAFLGGEGRPGTYPAVLFWLAVRLGLTPDEARHFRSAVLQLKAENKPTADLRLALTMVPPPVGQPPSEFWKSVAALRRVASAKTIEDCCAALEAVVGVLPAAAALQILIDAEAETLRFTLEGA